MWITVLLGATFLGVQAYEYMHAYRDLNLKLSSGIFGSTFFMLTGFHGFHVFVGMLMLLFITLRLMKGHFTPQRHFGFEGAAWYWHFVDVVWLGLYVLVYWLCSGRCWPARSGRRRAACQRAGPSPSPSQQHEAGTAPPTAPTRTASARAICAAGAGSPSARLARSMNTPALASAPRAEQAQHDHDLHGDGLSTRARRRRVPR